MRGTILNKTILLFLTILSCGILSAGQMKLIRVDISQPQVIPSILSEGISLDHARIRPNVFAEVIVSAGELESLQSLGLTIEVLQEDMEAYYAARLTGNVTRDLGYGTMGGYYIFDEVVDFLDNLRLEYPQLVSEKQIIGYSLEDRPIYAVLLTLNPEATNSRPEMLYTALHHSREPMSMMTLLYFMDHLAQNYGTDPEITALLENRRMWFVPVVNPDGYVYNYQIAPAGGGMQRKNRRAGCLSSQWAGVDLNRNYGFAWGWDDEGSSPDICDQTYRGTGPFSEPETQAVSAFVENHEFRMVLNYHSYGSYLIYPSGAIPGDLPPEEDLLIFREFGNEMAQYNGYLVGSDMETVNYAVNGDSDAWMYNEMGIFSMTPEVGRWEDGFWPSTNRIIPLAEENVFPNKYAAWAVGSKYKSDLQFSSEIFLPGETYTLSPYIFNQGLGDSEGDVQVEVSAYGNVIMEDAVLNIGVLTARTGYTAQVPVEFTIPAGTPAGNVVDFTVRIWDDVNYQFVSQFQIVVGQPILVFHDGAEAGMSNWSTNGWSAVQGSSTEGNYSFTDSPFGNYGNLTSKYLVLNSGVNLNSAVQAYLTYDVKWDIESGYDFAQVLASADGVNWIPLQGEFMSVGSGNGMQSQGEYGYDGSSDWVSENIWLNEFTGSGEVLLKFTMASDTYVTGDGVFVDNIKVFIYEDQSIPGDVNADGSVDVLDIVLIVNVILTGAELTPEQLYIMDLNGDGSANILDIVQLVNLILG